MALSARTKKILFIGVGILCMTPWVNPPLALLMGIVLALVVGDCFPSSSVSSITNFLLKASVVGLGFGLNINVAMKAGKDGLFFTVISIVATLAMGYVLGKKLKVDDKTTTLISSGTAICGGSAIAAMTPVIQADRRQVSVALGTVFILNSVALLVFPILGHWMDLSQTQFGYWAAIAIHDTSSVVGAASAYGEQALEIATSVKLERALWILPLSFLGSYVYKSGANNISVPYFIFLFVAAMMLNTYVPATAVLSEWIVPIARKGLTVTLFLIGSGLSMKVLKKVGIRPLAKGILLWIFIVAGSLWMILSTSV